MKLPHPRRHWLVWSLLALAILSAAGCSKPPKPKPATPIRQADADDIAQLIAATISADNGGWFFLVKTIAESLSVTPANGAGTPDTTSFSITKGSNTYQFRMAYLNAYQVGYPTRDTSSIELDAAVTCGGGHLLIPGSVDATYGYNSDWGFSVYGLRAEHDTLEFDNLGTDDSTFATVTSTLHSTQRFWYHPANYVDFYTTLKVLKSALPANPYPMSGEARWLIEAYVMKSDTTRDEINGKIYDLFLEASLTFNGTNMVTFRIADIIEEPSWVYVYTINLDTGYFQLVSAPPNSPP